MPFDQVEPRLNPERARENYDLLLGFARWMRSHTDVETVNAVKVVDQEGMGLGLKAVRRIAVGEVVVWYGGPYVPVKQIPEQYRTHSVHAVDHKSDVNQTSRAIDGKIMSIVFRDNMVLPDERVLLTTIAGALVNSTITYLQDENGLDYVSNVDTMMDWAKNKDLKTWSQQGVSFAARPLVAMREIQSGEDVLWRYNYYDHDGLDDSTFTDMIPPLAQPLTRKRIEVKPQLPVARKRIEVKPQ